MDAELASIIIPVFNGADYVREAIESALAQTWYRIEVIVVDDGSDDGGATQRIIRDFGTAVRCIRQENAGVAAALNTGLAAMRGGWFCWLSHDDLYHPQRVARHLAVLRSAGERVVTFSDVDTVDERGRFAGHQTHTAGFPDDGTTENNVRAVLEGRLNGCAMTIPRRVLEEANGFDPGLPTTQDYALWFKLAGSVRYLPVPGALVRQRVHVGQGSRSRLHLEEANLLWTRMVEELSAADGTGPKVLRGLKRAHDTLKIASYAGARAFVKTKLREGLARLDVDVLVRRPTDGLACAGAKALVDASGIVTRNFVLTDEGSLRQRGLHFAAWTGGLDARIARLGPAPSPATLVRAALGAGDSPIVIILDAGDLPSEGVLLEALLSVASGEAAAYLGPGEPFRTGIFDRSALEAAGFAEARTTAEAIGCFSRLGRCIHDANLNLVLRSDDMAPADVSVSMLNDPPDQQRIAAGPSTKPTILILIHTWGGGTQRLAEIVGAAQQARANVLWGWGISERYFCLASKMPLRSEMKWDLARSGLQPVVAHLRSLGVSRVDVMHTIGFDLVIEDFLDALGVPYDVTLTDYHNLANGPHLLDDAGYFVGDAALRDPAHPARRPLPPRRLLMSASRLIACSRDLAWRATRLTGGMAVIPARVPEPNMMEKLTVQVARLRDGETMRIFYLGALTANKGIREIAEVGRIIEKDGLPFHVYCLGSDTPDALNEFAPLTSSITLLGGFRDEELNTIVCALRPHLAWLPFTAPETYSFALSDCMRLGLPLLTNAVGAIPERVHGRPNTWLLPPKAGAPEVIGWLRRIYEDRLATAPCWAPVDHLPPLVRKFYEVDYLRPDGDPVRSTEAPLPLLPPGIRTVRRTLLISSILPCSNYSGGLFLRQIIRSCGMPAGIVSVQSDTVRPEVDPDLRIPMRVIHRPKEWHGPDDDPAATRTSELDLARNFVPEARKAILAFADEVDATDVWIVLEGQSLIRLARDLVDSAGMPVRVQVMDPPEWWLSATRVDPISRTEILEDFAHALRQSKMCAAASWNMASVYRERYGASTTAVVPAMDEATFLPPADAPMPGTLKIGLAGQAYAAEEFETLRQAMRDVARGGSFARVEIHAFSAAGSIAPDDTGILRLRPWIDQRDLVRELAAMDLLYCPYWFSDGMREAATLSFPSKLATYFAAGRPVLFHGPADSSPGQFLAGNEAAFLCVQPDKDAIQAALVASVGDTGAYARIARNGRTALEKFFGTEALRQSFAAFMQDRASIWPELT